MMKNIIKIYREYLIYNIYNAPQIKETDKKQEQKQEYK